jgi:phosphoribosylaminoimidazole carboxylase PurE protein
VQSSAWLEGGSDVDVKVGVVVGSATDLPYAEAALEVLGQLGIGAELRVLSAHRTPGPLEEYVRSAEERGIQVLVAMAGHAAALPGVVAARTTLPVIGVPLPTSDLRGEDSLLAIVQMPPGVPVATMAIGMPGARNAAWYAAAILGVADPAVAEALRAGREEMGERVLRDDETARRTA